MEKPQNEPGVCPLCGHVARVKIKKLNVEMVYTFMRLVDRWKRYSKFYSTRELFPQDHKATSDFTYLVYWGLLEKGDGKKAPVKTYAPTTQGLRFYHNVLPVPTHKHILNKEVTGESHNLVFITQVLKDSKYKYMDLKDGVF
jgi:hypothetical protein